MKKMSILALSAAGMMLMSGAAFAEMISGKITSIDPTEKSFKLQRLDSASGKTQELEIKVEDQTRYDGIQSLVDLQVGDEIQVEADQNILTRAWKARSIASASADAAADANAANNDAAGQNFSSDVNASEQTSAGDVPARSDAEASSNVNAGASSAQPAGSQQ